MKRQCQHPECSAPSARGAWALEQDAGGKWLFAVLCEAHGAVAESKGARRMSWRPKDRRGSATKQAGVFNGRG